MDAAEPLLSQWPEDDGEEYVAAVKKCFDTIVGVAPANHARQAQIATANGAGMRVISFRKGIQSFDRGDAIEMDCAAANSQGSQHAKR